MLNLTKHWWAGLMYDQLWTRYRQVDQGNYFLSGLIIRWSVPLKKEVVDFQVDGGVLQGNYCHCTLQPGQKNLPYRMYNSWYGGGGFNLRFQATKHWRGFTGIKFYELVNKSHQSEPIIHIMAGFQVEIGLKK